MTVLSDNLWRLTFLKQKNRNAIKPSEISNAEGVTIPCSVPGNVELDLAKAGYLPEDLFMGENLLLAEHYEIYEWWYQTEFEAVKPKENERLILNFEGVDCFAEYFLEDELLGSSHNMFMPVKFDISDKIHNGMNKLTVRIRSALLEEDQMSSELFSISSDWRRECSSSSVRKAPHSYGWDIMPRAISAGIWKNVLLETKKDVDFKQVYIVTRRLWDNKARLQINYEVDLPIRYYGSKLQMTVKGSCNSSKFEKTVDVKFKAGNIMVDIENPMLWWPYGYGDANLYEAEIYLTSEGEVITSRHVSFGIRTTQLIRSDNFEADGGSFKILINNTEIMAKGSNWVPLDVYHSRDGLRLKKALALVKDCGCNILRCWGGNVYEDKEFFDFCDKNGIMVWQDFAMACYLYPRTESFCEEIKNEAEYVIKKYRQHPCLVLWSGDNECDTALTDKYDPNVANKVTREILPDVVMRHDYLRPYLASSPFVSSEVYRTKRFSDMPEEHLWGPRDYFKSDFYKNSKAHFVSETGYHGCPSVESLKKFITTDSLWPYTDNREWNFHSTDQTNDPGRVMLMANQIRQLFGAVPDNLEEFSLLSQLSQAEAKKFFIERVRIDRPNKSGIIWWNLLDGWPQMSDAVVDYYFDKKIAYYYIRNCQQPFCVMCGENVNSNINIVAANDTLNEVTGVVEVYDADTNELLLTKEFEAGKNQNTLIGRIHSDYSNQRMLIVKWTANGKVGVNHHIDGFVPFNVDRFKNWYEKLREIYNIR